MAFDPDKYLAEKSATPAAPPAFDPDQYLASKNQAVPPTEPGLQEKLANALMKTPSFAGLGLAMHPSVLANLGKVLDTPGGLVRTGLAGAAGVATKDDFRNALLGQAPHSSEYMQRAGVPTGPSIGGVSARDVGGLAADVAVDPVTYLAPTEKIMGMGSAVQHAGDALYTSGLKNLDLEIAKYGKEPVSPILKAERITGNKEALRQQMEALADKRLAERNMILNSADLTGAETNVHASVAPGEQVIAQAKSSNDQRLNPLLQYMQGEVDTLKRSAGRASSPEIRASSLTPELMELPVSRGQAPLDSSRMLTAFEPKPNVGVYEAPTLSARANDGKANLYQKASGPNARGKGIAGEPIINNPVDRVYDLPQGGEYSDLRPANFEVGQIFPEHVLSEAQPRVKGPTPSQMSQMKTNSYNIVGDNGYLQAKSTPLYSQFEKAIASGQRAEVERSVGQSLGPEAQSRLMQKNDELGRLLSSSERATRDAQIEGRQNANTQVDGMLLGAGHVQAYALKQLSKYLNTTSARTNIGLGLSDIGQTGIPDAIARRALISHNPWADQK